MSILWQKVVAGSALLLGAIEAADNSTLETNYLATVTTSTLRGADYSPTVILDACIDAAMLIAQAICEPDAHPETTSFRVLSSAVSNAAAVPSTSSGSVPRIGPIRRVYDSSSASKALTRTTSQRVNDFNRLGSGTFGAYSPYLYAINGDTLEHTVTTAICEFCGFTRASITVNIGGSDVIPLNDEHEPHIINGAVARLAGKETMYADLAQQCDAKFQQHLASLRSYPDVGINVSGVTSGAS